MTDDADLTPEREAAVRRLLGAVGSGDGPALPPEVADRLDATLGELVAERSTPVEADAPLAAVVHLSSRRRRVFAGLFVAAAAVVVAGIGVPLVHDHADTQPTASSDAALSRPSSEDSPLAGTSAGGRLDSLHGEMNGSAKGMSSRTTPARTAAGPAVLRRQHLRTDLIRLRRGIPADASYASRKVHAAPGFTCATGRFGRGHLIGVRYAGAPAVVAFRAPAGATQVAEVLQCGTATVLRSVTLPV